MASIPRRRRCRSNGPARDAAWAWPTASFLSDASVTLRREKGHAFLIRGFSEILTTHPDSRLAVVGEGPLRGELELLIRELGLHGRAVLPGFVSDLDEVLPGFDLLVHPSLTEGLGSVLLQAMSRQVPVCASRAGGIPEAVIDGETGFLFSPGSAEALVAVGVACQKQSRPGPPAGGAGGRQGPVDFLGGADGGRDPQDLLGYTQPLNPV